MEKHRRIWLRFVFGLKDGDLGGSDLEHQELPKEHPAPTGTLLSCQSIPAGHRDVKVREAMAYG